MKKLFTLVAIAGLAFSTHRLRRKTRSAPVAPPPTTHAGDPMRAAPAATDPPPEEKK